MNKNILLSVLIMGGVIVLIIASMFIKKPAETGPVDVETSQEVSEENVPSDIPVYPNSAIKNKQDTDASDGTHITLSLSVEASISDINTWYRGALSSNGWHIKSDRVIGGYTIIQGEKDNLYTSMQAARGEVEGESIISQQIKIRH